MRNKDNFLIRVFIKKVNVDAGVTVRYGRGVAPALWADAAAECFR